MTDPEGYTKIGKRGGAYYLTVQWHDNHGPIQKRVGLGGKSFPDIDFSASEALALLAWLQQEEDTLKRIDSEEQP